MQTEVTALVVTSGETPYLSATLQAVTRQTLAPEQVIVLDVSNSGVVHRRGTKVIPVPGAANLGQAIEAARQDPDFPDLDTVQTRATTANPNLVATPNPNLDPGQVPPTRALWILHDDSAPGATCLEEQVKVLRSAENIKVVGPKQRSWDKASQILEVGIQATASGRRLQETDASEVDQGQYDFREDVLAVGSAGMLVEWQTFTDLEGFDPQLGPFGDGLEFSRRAHLAGHRVVIAPKALLYHKIAGFYGLRGPDGGRPTRATLGAAQTIPTPTAHQPTRPAALDPGAKLQPNPKRSFAARRAAQLYNWLLAAPWWQFWALPLVIVVLTVFRVGWRILTKEPRLAGAEARAALVTICKPLPVWRGRARIRRHRSQPLRTLRPFLIKGRRIWQAKLTQRRVAKDLRRPVMLDGAAQRNYYQERNLDRAVMWSLALVLAAVSMLAWRFALTGVAGGALANLPTDTGYFWRDLVSGWLNAGLGYGSVLGGADPLGLLLAVAGQGAVAIGVPGPVLLTLLLVGAMPLAWLAAWWASGVLTDLRPLRALAALSWALSPALLASLGQGEVAAWVLAVALPICVGAVARATGIGVHRTVMGEGEPVGFTVYSSRVICAGVASLAGFFAVAACQVLIFVLAVLVALSWLKGAAKQPGLQNAGGENPTELIQGTLATRVVTRTRLKFTHLVIILLPATVLVVPTLLRTLTRPSQWPLWISTLSVPHSAPSPRGWELLAGWPLGLTQLSLPLQLPGWQILAYAPVLLLLAQAALAVLIPRSTTGSQWGAIFALLGLGLALLSVQTPVALAGATPVTAWAGPGLLLYHAGLIVSVLFLVSRAGHGVPAELRTWVDRGSRLAAVVAVVVPVLAAAPMLANLMLSPNHGFNALSAFREDSLPATVTQGQAGPLHQRALQLRISPAANRSTLITVNVWNNQGQSTWEASPWLKLKNLQLTTNPRVPDAADLALSRTVASLAGGATPNLAESLAQLDVKFVVVPTAKDFYTTNLMNNLDSTAGLERVTTTAAGTVWRLSGQSEAALGRVTTASWKGGVPTWPDDATVETLTFSGNRATLPAGPEGRVLALSWRADANLVVRLDGKALERAEGTQWNALYRLPAQGGTLTVNYNYFPHQLWGAALVVALLVALAAAAPVRRVSEVR